MRQALAATLLALSCIGTLACRDTPTEPTPAKAAPGLLVIHVTQPCSLPGVLEVVLQEGPTAQVSIPGDTSLSVAPGHYAFYFRRGTELYARSGSAGFVDISSGVTTTISDPPEACVVASQRQ